MYIYGSYRNTISALDELYSPIAYGSSIFNIAHD